MRFSREVHEATMDIRAAVGRPDVDLHLVIADRIQQLVELIEANRIVSGEAEKLVAIESGGDWHDASVVYLAVPKSMDVEAELAAHRRWYSERYLPAFRSGERGLIYISFVAHLKLNGARDAADLEVEVYFDD